MVLTYCRGVDRMDRGLVRSCYHADATEEHGSFSGTIDGYLDWVWRVLSRYERTQHFVGNLLIELRGDRAHAETYGIAFHEGDAADPTKNLAVGFRYLDRFERRDDGGWRIVQPGRGHRLVPVVVRRDAVAESRHVLVGERGSGIRSTSRGGGSMDDFGTVPVSRSSPVGAAGSAPRSAGCSRRAAAMSCSPTAPTRPVPRRSSTTSSPWVVARRRSLSTSSTTRPRACSSTIAAAEFGGIHTLVHAAGPTVPQLHLSKVSPAQLREAVDQEVGGFFAVAQPALPHLRASAAQSPGAGSGNLVAVTTAATHRFPVRDGLSSGPKAAIESLVRALAAEEGRFGVRANCVGPGMLTDGMAERLMASGDLDDAALEVTRRNIALRRFGTAIDIAEAVCFLASDRANFVSGVHLLVDGGYGI